MALLGLRIINNLRMTYSRSSTSISFSRSSKAVDAWNSRVKTLQTIHNQTIYKKTLTFPILRKAPFHPDLQCIAYFSSSSNNDWRRSNRETPFYPQVCAEFRKSIARLIRFNYSCIGAELTKELERFEVFNSVYCVGEVPPLSVRCVMLSLHVRYASQCFPAIVNNSYISREPTRSDSLRKVKSSGRVMGHPSIF